MVDEAKLHSPFHSTSKRWLCDMPLDVVVEKNWAIFVDQCWLQALQFLVHLIDLLSIRLRCNDFAGIQNAFVDQNGSRTPVTMTFFRCKFGSGKGFGDSSQCSH